MMSKSMKYTERNVEVFNNPIEFGLRALIILKYTFPAALDLNTIIIYDYFITHSSDLDESIESLHPPIPHRSGELVVKRKAMQDGLNLMYSRELIDVEYNSSGISYKSNELSGYFIKYFNSSYSEKLTFYSDWVNSQFEKYSFGEINKLVNDNISDWGSEFTKESLVRGGFSD